MQEVLKKLAPALRAAGFRGSGQSYRKHEGDFVFVINFQRSRWGDLFYVNLGAQPVFIPAEGHAELRTLKEYECWLRRRVGRDWPQRMSAEQLATLESELLRTQAEFFNHAQTLRTALAVDSVEMLLQKFTTITTEARASLHLARAAVALGLHDKARALVSRGFELADDRAVTLHAELRAVLEDLNAVA